MKPTNISRRMFLTGTGAALVLPFLPSLLSRRVRADITPRPIRYVQIINPYGANTEHFYGTLAPSEQVEPYVGIKKLSDVAGDISGLVGPKFTPLKDKFSIIHGMDVIAETNNHNMCFPTCASGYAKGLSLDNSPPLSGQPSVDVMMANSPRVYTGDIPQARRLLNINPVATDSYTRQASFSWKATSSGTIEMFRPTKTTLGLQDILLIGADNGERAAEQLLLNAVHEDYRRVRDSARLSAADRNRLETYMGLVQDMASTGPACQAPTLDDEVDTNAVIKNQWRLVAAAMLCDLTRVASITLGASETYEVRHGDHHDSIPKLSTSGLYADLVVTGQRVAELVDLFATTDDQEGSLLDNSLIYWSMQYGNACPSDVHRSANMPVLVAGSAGGMLKTGYYIDYRKDRHLSDTAPRGVPINNLLVTFMNCMGLSSADYEPQGRPGYGYYNTVFFENTDRANPEFWSSVAGRRTPLPFFYQGPVRG